tara:strand:+ start:1761 stop:2654 length:894 start_codon:yes stop_codon:yes gene_type:complete
MKIGYFGDGNWAHQALELINKESVIDIKFICARFDNPDQVLKQKAYDLGIEFIFVKNVNSDEFIKKLKNYKCDLLVSMSFNQIFKESIISMPKLGIINCHAGKLPLYRGRNVLNWVLINDEKEFGITVHYVDEGIDTGDIIIQEIYQIKDTDTYKTLLEKAYTECPKLLLKAIKKIINNDVKSIDQKIINDSYMYCSRRKEGDEIINWNSTSRELFNFVRALSYPGPCATTFIEKNPIKIIKSSLVNNASKYIGIPGTVLEKNQNWFLVKTIDSYIKITEWDSSSNIYNGLRFSEGI